MTTKPMSRNTSTMELMMDSQWICNKDVHTTTTCMQICNTRQNQDAKIQLLTNLTRWWIWNSVRCKFTVQLLTICQWNWKGPQTKIHSTTVYQSITNQSTSGSPALCTSLMWLSLWPLSKITHHINTYIVWLDCFLTHNSRMLGGGGGGGG